MASATASGHLGRLIIQVGCCARDDYERTETKVPKLYTTERTLENWINFIEFINRISSINQPVGASSSSSTALQKSIHDDSMQPGCNESLSIRTGFELELDRLDKCKSVNALQIGSAVCVWIYFTTASLALADQHQFDSNAAEN